MREAPDRELAAHAGKRARPVVHPIPPVWDVLASCDIAGASDSSIRNAVPNDFTPMLAESHIGRVLCTGRTAYALWRRHCA
ncbi:MAG: DNA-deoxyinosine glycosylase, partial [Treponema sp.]|nr:DNA-deoxyinosine glycosylase [Treponema sp.]